MADPAHNGHVRRAGGRGRDLADATRSAPAAHEARLTADSGDRAGERGPRVLVFVHAATVVALEVTPAAGPRRRRVEGAVTPAPSARMTVRTRRRGRPQRTLADPAGRFALDGVPGGPFSLALQLGADAAPLVTEWVVL